MGTNFFVTVPLRRILFTGGRYIISNNLVLRETGLSQVTDIVRLRQLRIYGHVAQLPAGDFAHQILACPDPWG